MNPSSPSYVRVVADHSAPLRRLMLNLLLRLTVKHAFKHDADLAVLRNRNASMDRRLAPRTSGMRRQAVDAGGVPAEWLSVPDSLAQRTLLYLHGGAFIFRTPNVHAAMVGSWCRQMKARALMVDYRLAPEHPYPAAPDDCLAAYRWLLAQGHAPGQIVIAGDSAGANLALATLVRIKAAGLAQPACALLLSPVVDFTMSSVSMVSNAASDPIFTLGALATLRALYARPEQFLNPDLSPLFADLGGLPPLFFQASNSELLRDESLRGARHAHLAGVKVEVELWQGMPHVFQAVGALPQSRAALASLLRFVAAHAGWA
ncbi:MAG: alpha/beta hydrolase [Pseudomonadota bacterium]